MAKQGHDGDAMPMGGPAGMGDPIFELPLGSIAAGSLAPTLLMMQNLPSVASFALSLAEFVLETDQIDELTKWMYNSMCENHRSELPADRIEELLGDHKTLLELYLKSLGVDDRCSHEKGH